MTLRAEPGRSLMLLFEQVFIKDLRTIVIDLGSSHIKAGYAGNDAPETVFSSVVGHVPSSFAMDLERHAHIDRDWYVGDEAYAHPILRIKVGASDSSGRAERKSSSH